MSAIVPYSSPTLGCTLSFGTCVRTGFMYLNDDVAGRSVFFILVSGLSVFWHFNGSDFVAACKYNTVPPAHRSHNRLLISPRSKISTCRSLPCYTSVGRSLKGLRSCVLFSCRVCPPIQALTSSSQVPLSQLDFVTVSRILFLNPPTYF